MNTWKQVYQKWNDFEQLDASLRNELKTIANNEAALEDAFYKELTFGTGGMRGIIGPGSNRMNIYTVRKAVHGLSNHLLEHRVNVKDRGVVIAYDSRHMSQAFALEAAKVLGTFGMKAYVFESLHPTPLLSFAVRYFGAAAGIMITASHNPPEYNGFKVYNEEGGQITPEEANEVITAVNRVQNELTVPVVEEKELEKRNLIQWVNGEVDHAYLEKLLQITKMDEEMLDAAKDLKIVFTPLHGTSENLVRNGLQQLNFEHVHVVEEQAVPDPEFSTVESPNPEEHQAFAFAITLGKKVNADVLLGTDPDADRLGVAVKDATGEYQVLTGNQLGSLLLDYLLMHSDDAVLLSNARMLKTIVTTELGRSIADSYGVTTIDTLTGFKYIGEKINEFDATGETFVFGFEESYGYLISSFARDKDAVQAAVMAAEMAQYWKDKGKTLLEALDMLHQKHGYYLEGISSLTLKGKEGSEKIKQIMEHVRQYPLSEIAGLETLAIEDYAVSKRTNMGADNGVEKINLPKENVVKYQLANNSWVCLRPSGTEPKIKCYYGVCGGSLAESEKELTALKDAMDQLIKRAMGVE
ncbi:phospho-sugar mutase [Virgibacillus sp. W0181]|uniref:phospho-sugar mutase n=1 Tax=Virgibacillus sp. W0181 TaxID=3391581 RepID=UPI003F445669